MRVRAGGSGAEATEWVSGTSVVCRVGAGTAGSVGVAVTSGERAGSESAALTYDGWAGSGVAGANVATSGGESVSVAGQDLGTSR